jgi:N-acetylmuramoyl-L-alanine amidase
VSAPASVIPSPSADPGIATVIPAPGSTSEVYAPNPAALLIAIEPGHGGCLDWGVPDPFRRGEEYAEKTMTLGIAERLRDLLTAQDVEVLLLRDGDEALAGDDYPHLGCTGPAWRDIDGDGRAGFEETGRVRTRDELQARIDRANLARADILVSIHINSITEDGVVYEIAATQTFYDDETPWGEDASGPLAEAIQEDVVAALDPVADYERQDRGTDAVAYYAVSRGWQDGDTCETAGDTWCKPHRAIQMPGVLSEVGSITLRDEQDLLSDAAGQMAAASGLYDGIARYLAEREIAVRYDLPGTTEPVPPGDGPLQEAWILPDDDVELILTNRGTEAWPANLQLVAGWQASELPYLASAPERLEELPVEVPSLAPGESVRLVIPLQAPPGAERQIAWISLSGPTATWAELGSPPAQAANMGLSAG